MRKPFTLKLWKYFINSLPAQYIFLSVLGLLAFHQIFSFWFFRGWETSWLGLTGGDYSFVELMKSHGFIYYFNFLLFGWKPTGWFVTAFILHMLTTFTVVYFLGKLLKSRTVAFLTGLVFVATTAHHDVITWGSFESLYAAQTFGFYLTLLFFYFYHKKKSKIFYAFSLVTFFLAAVLRESGLILIPVLFLFDLLFFNRKIISDFVARRFNRKNIRTLIFAQIPFWIVGLLYIVLRISYGGSPHDFIDERVQFRILLLNERRFLEYIGYAILAFGQYIPPYFIPYPILNFIKEGVLARLPFDFIRYYFFAAIGWGFYGALILTWLLQRKSKVFVYLSFFLIMFTIITGFYSLAWTVKLSFLSIPYSWSENRWRYFAFTALAPFLLLTLFNLSAYLRKRSRFPYIYPVLIASVVVGYVVVNFIYLQFIQNEMYTQNHYPSKQFYSTFTKEFPSITEDTRFYQYRGSPGLNDFFAELSVIKEEFYPDVKNLPADWVRVDMYYPLLQLSNGTLQKDKFHFVDYSIHEGVKDKTTDVYRFFSEQESISYGPEAFRRSGSLYSVKLSAKSPVEFRKMYVLRYTMSPQYRKEGPGISGKEYSALNAYSKNMVDLRDASVKVCKTMGPDKEPLYDFRGEYVIDGNLGKRSQWWADCRPAWIMLDLGKERELQGFSWGSYIVPDAVPRHYYYEVSVNGNEWTKVKEVKGNLKQSSIDVLDRPVAARYVRFFIVETEYRAMAIVNEFHPIFSEAGVLGAKYNSQTDLFADMYMLPDIVSRPQYEAYMLDGNPIVWVKVVWQTSPSNDVPEADRTLFIPLVADGKVNEYTFELPESEYYSTQNQFLERFITDMTFLPPDNADLTTISLTEKPMFPVK